MARKGSHSKKGSAQNSLKSKKNDPEVRVVSDKLFDVDVQQHNSHSAGDINPFPGDVKDNHSKAYHRACDQKVDASKGNSFSVHDSSDTIKGVDSFGSRDLNKPYISDDSSENRNGVDTTSSSYTDIWMDRMQFSKIVALESLKHFALSMLRMSWGWLERQKPVFSAVVNHIYRVRDMMRMKLVRTYPVVRKWLFQLGNVLLLVSVIWLDCAFRGMESFLQMGTTSFLSVLWFSILSVIAMTGVFKFLLVLAATVLIGVLVGFMIALFVTAASGAIFLWFYGSFWMTSLVVILAGLGFMFSYERLALLITTLYSVYCAWTYVGWLGVLLGLNLSFFSSDALIYFLKNNIDEQRSKGFEQTDGHHGGRNFFNGEAHYQYSDIGSGQSSDRSAGVASTSGTDSDITSEDEVVRLLNCTDHYSALGLTRYQQVDVSVLKREYRKKAMLVHPDKNMGNEKAVEAFKKLQNAYEVLLDSLKRKAYDDELKREELLNYFCRFQSASQKNGRHDFFPNGFARSEGDGEDPRGEFRRIACKKCGGFHVWLQTKKSKLKARWCQDCKDLHQAKDGDGWVEQSSQPLFFGILQKVDLPVAYVCADSKVYDATEWYICQGMRCAANTHKPSFHVNTNVTRNNNSGKGSSSTHRGASNVEENMSEEEFFEWIHNAMQSGVFENFGGGPSCESPQTNTKNSSKSATTASGGGSSSSKRKKKGKKQW